MTSRKHLEASGSLGFVAAALLIVACGATSNPGNGSPGAAGTSGGAGTGAAGTGSAGTTATAGTAGGQAGTQAAAGTQGGDAGTQAAAGTQGGTAGTQGGTAGTQGGTAGTQGGTAGTQGGTAGTGASAPLKSAGCGMPPGGADSQKTFVEKLITVTGVDPAFITAHPANAGGSWTNRNYYLRLPTGYDPATPVALTMAGTGCGGSATVGSSGDYVVPPGASQTVAIQIGLSYVPSNSVNTCATFADGYTNSPEPAYISAIVDDVASKYCIDRNKVFVNGYSSGAWMAALTGCTNPDKVRGFGVQVGGGLRTRPTCMNKPAAAMLVVGLADTGNPIGPLATPQNGSYGSVGLRDEILKRNGCVAADFQIVDTCPAASSANGAPCAPGVAIGDTYSNVPNVMWNATYPKCHMYTGCPAKYPVVWCPLDVNHGNGPNPMGTDGGATVEKYRLQGLWDFYNSLPAP